MVKLLVNPPAMQETWVQSQGWEDALEKGKATHSSILAWRIPDCIVHVFSKSWTQLSDFHLHTSLCMKCSLGIFNFLEKISSLSHSVVFLYSFFHCSLKKAFLYILAVFWNSAFRWVYLSFSPLPVTSLLFSAICKASSDNRFAFCISFSWGWFWYLPPEPCYEQPFTVLQALCLPDLIPWIYSSLPLYSQS